MSDSSIVIHTSSNELEDLRSKVAVLQKQLEEGRTFVNSLQENWNVLLKTKDEQLEAQKKMSGTWKDLYEQESAKNQVKPAKPAANPSEISELQTKTCKCGTKFKQTSVKQNHCVPCIQDHNAKKMPK
jgi:hypothetical protein